MSTFSVTSSSAAAVVLLPLDVAAMTHSSEMVV
jgi:hypothetical protein